MQGLSKARGLPGKGRSEAGSSMLKAIFWTAVVVAAFFVAFKIIPPYVANYQILDRMQTEARFSVVNRRTDDQLRDIIYKEAQDKDVPIRREDIKILNTDRLVRISIDYTVTVDLYVYQLQLHFTPTAENRAVM